MTALPVSSVHGSIRGESSSLSSGLSGGFFSALRRAVAGLDRVEEVKDRSNARGKAAASANALLRDHGSLLPASL